jgi:endonuclease/exonuclease/phosphatase family metal-dependent hydrolase
MKKNLKVVTYNLQNGIQARQLVKNIEKMAEQGANLFCFQEFRRFQKRQFVGEKLKERFSEGWGIDYYLNENTHDLGLCIMWKKSELDLVRTEKILLPKIKKLHKTIKVLGRVFFERDLPVQRGAIVADFKAGNFSVRVANAHIDWIGGVEHKAGQLRSLVNHLEKKSITGYEIVCGDFNTVGPLGLLKQRRKKILAAFDGKFIDVSSGLGLTSHSFQKLDYIFSRGFKAAKAKKLFWLGSDHMPLWAQFDF